MSIEDVLNNYVETYFIHNNDLDNALKLQKQLDSFFKHDTKILKSTAVPSLIHKNISNILRVQYGLPLTGADAYIYLKDGNYVSSAYNKICITPFNVYLELSGTLSKYIDQLKYVFLYKNKYYISLKFVNMLKFSKYILRIVEADINIRNNKETVFEKPLDNIDAIRYLLHTYKFKSGLKFSKQDINFLLKEGMYSYPAAGIEISLINNWRCQNEKKQ